MEAPLPAMPPRLGMAMGMGMMMMMMMGMMMMMMMGMRVGGKVASQPYDVRRLTPNGVTEGEVEEGFYTVLYEVTRNTFHVEYGIDRTRGVAFGQFVDTISSTGWGRLDITSSPKWDDDTQMRAVGYLEGFLTVHRIAEFREALRQFRFNATTGVPHDLLLEFLTQQKEWVARTLHGIIEQIPPIREEGAYWRHVLLVMAQLGGLVYGFNDARRMDEQPLTEEEAWLMNSEGDLDDLLPAIAASARMRWNSLSKEQATQETARHSRCSALIRYTKDNLFVGHATFATYSEMLRIFKYYTLHLHIPGTVTRRMGFPSYPGILTSIDDFYLLDSGLLVTETSLPILDEQFLDRVPVNESIPCWLRSIATHRLASNGAHWGEILSRYNSGTYNNQWLVVDYNKFKRGGHASLKEGTLTLVEQVPGMVVQADVTEDLQHRGYFGSYNRPYFDVTFNLTGYAAYAARFGALYTYHGSARALQFAREAPHVHTLEDMKRIMRLNQWPRDNLTFGNPLLAIAARLDLLPTHEATSPWALAYGATDAKVTSSDLMTQGVCHAIAGPTHQDQPVFTWSVPFLEVYHQGQPLRWDFGWNKMEPLGSLPWAEGEEREGL